MFLLADKQGPHAWHGAWYWGPRFLLPLSVFGALYLALWLQYFPACKKLAYALIASTYLVYKCGVVIGQSYLIECLRLNPANESCYWNWQFSPFASWLNPGDLGDMLTHHSMAVELIGIALLLVLIRQYRAGHGPGDLG